MVDRLKKQYEGKIEFKLYNVEKDEAGAALAKKYGARYVPTFVLLNSDGSKADTIVGAKEAELVEALKALK